MICVGAYTTPHYPQIPGTAGFNTDTRTVPLNQKYCYAGLEQFTGRVMHSNDYRYPDPFR